MSFICRQSIKVQGRRLVDINHIFETIQNNKHEGFGCTFTDLNLIKEIRTGFFSQFFFKCKLCNKIEIISSEPKKSSSMSVNTAIVSSVVSNGQGYGQLEQFSAILNMPCMANRTYQKEHEQISSNIEVTMWQALESAAKEEASLAVLRGDINENGIPLITVVADGAWSKRSYKTNYNALSGVVSTHFMI